MKKIIVGLFNEQKEEYVKQYLQEHPEITSVVYFHPDKIGEPLDLSVGVPVEKRTWDDAIMYKYFYPLLEKINHNTLLIFDEMMRTRKRNDLTYNCCHHYGNQTEHIIVFEFLPMIEAEEDFMILVDFAYPNVYKGVAFDDSFLMLDGVQMRKHPVVISKSAVDVSEEMRKDYEAEKERLFDQLGNRDPDTLVRDLHLWCGTYCKKDLITDGRIGRCLVRKPRAKIDKSKLDTLFTCIKWDAPMFAENIIDFPIRQLQFNDYLRRNPRDRYDMTFWYTGLSADIYYWNRYDEWCALLGGMYEETSLYI